MKRTIARCALQEVANRNGVPLEEVITEIQAGLTVAYATLNLPVPSPEEYLCMILEHCCRE